MKRRILVLDDDTDVLDMLTEVLTYENFSVKTTDECNTIYKEIDDYNPDVILLDYLVGRINGGEICHQIKSNPATCHIPVIIMSAYPRVIASLGNYGCNYFMPKPFDFTQLINTIDQLSSKRTLCV